MIRSSRRAASVGLAVLLLSGCGSASVRPGAAALVGDERIATDRLQQAVERGLSDPQAAQQLGQDRPAFQRQTLSRLINREVLEAAAARQGVTVDDGDVDDQLQDFVAQAGGREALEAQAAAQLGVAPEDLEGFVRDIVLQQALGDALTEDEEVPREQLQTLYAQAIAQGRFDQVTARHILVAEEAQARSILAQVQADPSRFGALAAEFSSDRTNKDDGGDLGTGGRGRFVPEFEQLLFTAKPGSFGVVRTEFGWHVVHVLERTTTSVEEAAPELRRVALQEQRDEATQSLLRAVADDLGVEVNPRFGRWDGEAGTVEALDDPNGVMTSAPEQAEQPGPEGGEPAPEEQPLIDEAPEPAPTADR